MTVSWDPRGAGFGVEASLLPLGRALGVPGGTPRGWEGAEGPQLSAAASSGSLRSLPAPGTAALQGTLAPLGTQGCG